MAQPLIINADFLPKLQCLFRPMRHKVLWGGRGGGKCLKVGTRIIMFDGSLRRIEDVKTGELVMGPDSLPRTVLSTSRGIGPLYRVSQTSAMDYIVNENHILSLKKSGYSKNDKGDYYGKDKHGKSMWEKPNGRYGSWPDITNIAVTDFIAKSAKWQSNFHGYRAGTLVFPESVEVQEIDPYFLGVWLGDGTSRELRITSMDPEILEYCNVIADQWKLAVSATRKAGQLAYDIGLARTEGKTNKLWQKFVALGLKNDKHIPFQYLVGKEVDRLALLAGIIDTDGTVHHNGYIVSSSIRELAVSIKRLADNLGFRTNISVKKTTHKDNYLISINGDVWRVPCKIERKKLAKDDIRKNKDFLRSQISISLEGIGEYAGIGIDGDHLFLLEDGTVTHNSWGIARALLLLGAQRPIRVLCARELQKSIRDSVHKLLSDQIVALGLESVYEVQTAVIKNAIGTEFAFEGIRHNISGIRSYEGIDLCWVEEANAVSKSSWDILIPTIRKPGSEIWISFNPELETDETYSRFVKNPPADTTVVQITWEDNPWFTDVMRREMEDLRARDYDSYLHVWMGQCRVLLDGAVYMDELRDAATEGRITKVDYDRTCGVSTFWDLGWADMTSIWFAQAVGFEYRIIDFYQNSRKPLDHYLDTLQRKGYLYDTDWLPHDARAKQLGTGRSIEELMRAKGRNVRIVPGLSLVDGINATRTIFPNCWFDADRCSDGVQALRHYKYEIITADGNLSKVPVHDDNSHAADAFRYLGIALKQPKRKSSKILETVANATARLAPNFLNPNSTSTNWMR